jgi:hypothetical protein
MATVHQLQLRFLFILVLGLAAFFCLASNSAHALEDTRGNRLAQAERYVDGLDVRRLWDALSTGMLANVPAEKRNDAKRALDRVNLEHVRAIFVDVSVQVFTADELAAMADFYSSPAGRAIFSKTQQFYAMASPALEQEIRKVLGEH